MGSGGFCAGFPGGDLGIDAPGDDGGKGVKQHVNQTGLPVIGRKYREDDHQRSTPEPGMPAHETTQMQIADRIGIH